MYFEQSGWTLNQEWMVPMFAWTWQYGVAQHSALRTACWEDWSDLRPAGQEARLETYLQPDQARGFDLNEAPAVRATM